MRVKRSLIVGAEVGNNDRLISWGYHYLTSAALALPNHSLVAMLISGRHLIGRQAPNRPCLSNRLKCNIFDELDMIVLLTFNCLFYLFMPFKLILPFPSLNFRFLPQEVQNKAKTTMITRIVNVLMLLLSVNQPKVKHI